MKNTNQTAGKTATESVGVTETRIELTEDEISDITYSLLMCLSDKKYTKSFEHSETCKLVKKLQDVRNKLKEMK